MKRNALSLMIGALLATAPALAQEPGDDDTRPGAAATSLDTVVVTARKREETLQDVPIAVTAFSAESLDKLNIRDLGGLGAAVPNLTIYAARGSSSTVTAYIRGIGQSDPLWGFDPGVGLYLDDVYIARPQGGLLDVFDVERIEVLRGPQGTLYGKNTIGGAIKYISRGLPKTTEGFAEVTVGNYSQLDVKAALGGPIGGQDSGLRGRIALASLNRDGFGEYAQNGQPVSDKQINAARLSLGAFASDDFDVQLALDWIDDMSGVRGNKMLAPNPFAPPFPPLDSRYDIRSGMRNLNDFTGKGGSITANWLPGEDWALKYVLARRESETHGNIDFDATPLPIADVRGYYEDDQVSHELQFNYDGGGRARGVFGLYKFDGNAGGRVYNNFFNLLFGDSAGEVRTDSIALYADWTFDLAQRLKLDVGARYTDEDKRAIVFNRGFADPDFTIPISVAADFDKTVSFQNVSPKVSLDFQLTPDVMLYVLAARGFKSGGFNIRANSVAVPRSADPFDDETVDSFEAGGKMALLDSRLFLNLAAFHNRYKDIQLSVFTSFDSDGDGVDDQFFGDFTNAGRGTVNGIELEYQFLPSPNWAIAGNLAWLDAEYDEYIDAGTNVADQKEFTNAPEFSGALNVEYRRDLANGGQVSANVGYAYRSEVWPTTDLSPEIRQDGYGLLNAGLIWRIDDAWRIALQGTNLTDKEYRTSGYNIPAVGSLLGFYGPPRQYTLSVHYAF